jgi:hypothetical protein
MVILTIELVALLLAAWKAPGWIKEIGLIALMTGLLVTTLGMQSAARSFPAANVVAQNLFGDRVAFAMETSIYGMFIYLVSLVIRIVQKPRKH